MHFIEVATFEVLHRHLAWPWVAVDVSRTHFAFASADDRISSRRFLEGDVTEGAVFPLPNDLRLPGDKRPEAGHRGSELGIHAFSIDAAGQLLAVTATLEGGTSVIVTLGPAGEKKRSRIDALTGGDHVAHAVACDRSGARLWISAESAEETVLLVIDAHTHAPFGIVRSDPFPPPSFHELHVHPQDDAALLLAACGQDGTFARVAGWSDGPPTLIANALENGSISAGFVGFSADGARVHLAGDDGLRTHAWPSLEPLSAVEPPADFHLLYSGAVMGDRIFVDGEDGETGDDAVMRFDRTAILGAVMKPPVPTGMWVGRIGIDGILTVDAKGDPAPARVVRLPAPDN
jgi:hypothetical protein